METASFTYDWFHVAVVYDPDVSRLKAYINGVESSFTIDQTNDFTYTPQSCQENVQVMLVGSENSMRIDELTYWKRPLSLGQIRTIIGNDENQNTAQP